MADEVILSAMVDLTRQVPAASTVVQHAVDLVVATREGDANPVLARALARLGELAAP